MVDVRGDVLRPPHGTTPFAVKSNIKSEMRSFKSNENIQVSTYGSTIEIISISLEDIRNKNVSYKLSVSKFVAIFDTSLKSCFLKSEYALPAYTNDIEFILYGIQVTCCTMSQMRRCFCLSPNFYL